MFSLVEIIGLEMLYKSTNKEEDENRWENVQEFLNHIKENYENQDISIAEFLHSVSLENNSDENNSEDYITVATMHAAKGLEFKVVFIVACEEGIIPSSRSIAETNGIEEERRVMYVAITRAQERLYISCVNGDRMKYGRRERVIPSRFVSECKGEIKPVIEDIRRMARADNYYDDYSSAIPENRSIKKIDFMPNLNIENKPVVKTGNTSDFISGAKIEHRKYGIGTIILSEGEGIGKTVTVAFKDLGIKKFAVASAPIKLI